MASDDGFTQDLSTVCTTDQLSCTTGETLTRGTTYHFRVSAENQQSAALSNFEAYGPTIVAKGRPISAPGKPRNLQLSALQGTVPGFKGQWQAPQDTGAGGLADIDINKYKMEQSDDGGGSW